MMLLGLIIFIFCTWAVFSKHFCDGLITKHFLVFAAITSMLVVVNPANGRAALAASLSLIGGLAYWVIKHRRCIREHLEMLHH